MAEGDTFDLFSNNLLGSFDSFELPTLSGGLEWDTSDLTAGETGTLSVIPEPGTLGQVAVFGCQKLSIFNTKW